MVTAGLGLHNRDGGASKSEKIAGFRIDDPSLREALGLPKQEGSDYSFEDLESHQEELKALVERLQKQGAERDLKSQEAIRNLFTQVDIYLKFRTIETPHRIFKIDNLDVLSLLGLSNRKGYRYSLDEFSPRIGALSQEVERAKKLPDNKRTRFDEKVLRRRRIWNATYILHISRPIPCLYYLPRKRESRGSHSRKGWHRSYTRRSRPRRPATSSNSSLYIATRMARASTRRLASILIKPAQSSGPSQAAGTSKLKHGSTTLRFSTTVEYCI